MNDEIKEILDKIKDGIGKFEEYDNNALLESDECEILLDYITNLQQRIQKAINKMQYIKALGFDYDGFNNVDDLKKLIDELVNIAIDSVDILIGEDK